MHEGLLLWPSSGPGELVEKEKHGVRLSAGGRVEGEMLNVSRGQSKLVLVTACPLNATECQVVVLPDWVLSFPTPVDCTNKSSLSLSLLITHALSPYACVCDA